MGERLVELKEALTATFDASRERLSFEALRARIEDIRELERDRKDRLAFFITAQIESFEKVGEGLATNLQTFERMKSLALQAKQLSQQNIACPGLDGDKIRRIGTLRRNLTAVLETFNDFIGINRKLEELEKLQTDEANYPLINDRLTTLLSLQRALGGGADGAGKFAEKFSQLNAFRAQFMQRVLVAFDDYIDRCRENPDSLRQAADIADRADMAEEGEKHRQSVLDRLSIAVVRRFDQRLGEKREIHFILENIKFSVDDLLVMYEYLQPLFPPRYGIFAFMENAYKVQIELKVLPFLQDFDYLRENPGTLVYLINWLNTYEKLLTKVGFASLSFGTLRDRIRSSMPFFTAHVEKMFSDYLHNIEKNDSGLLLPGAAADGILETNTPEDILHFLNEQIAFLGRYLDEELMTRLLGAWLDRLREFALLTTERFATAVVAPESIVLLCIGINNFGKLCLHLTAAKKGAATLFTTEIGRERLNQLFGGVMSTISQQIEALLAKMTLVSFADVEKEKFPLLFKESWTDDPVATVLNTLGDYHAALAPLLASQVHAKLYLRRLIERYFLCYFEQFIWIVKNAFHKDGVLQEYFPETLRVSVEKEANRKAIQAFLRRGERVQTLLARDAETFRVFFSALKQNFSDAFSTTTSLQADFIKARLFAGQPPTSVASGSPQLVQATAFLREKMR